MSDVKKVFITAEVAEIVGISAAYLVRLIKTIEFKPSELRRAGKRNYIFSEEAVKKIQIKLRDIRS